jgi:7-carboxy-7-deazaguanine synthase (Cx14CxxC type)
VAYTVKSIFMTLQGEGHNTGRAAVFCRFAGCNLWTGRERHRPSAVCKFCDTDFVGTDGPGGGRFASADLLADDIVARWRGSALPFIVLTGGEPTLQLDAALLQALHERGAEVAIETNGTHAVSAAVDWICVSPKSGAPFVQRSGDELKVAWPQEGIDLEALERLPFAHRWLQPIDGPRLADHVRAVLRECRGRPEWRPSFQMHKLIGIA